MSNIGLTHLSRMEFFPFLPIGPVHLCFKDCLVSFFLFIKFLIEQSVSKHWRPDCLPMSHEKDARLI